MSALIKIIFAGTIVLISPVLQGQARLEIEITNIRSEQGHILLSFYSDESQYPRDAAPGYKDIRIPKDELSNGTLKYVLEVTEPGSYVIAILDDENDSGDMDYNKVGLPLEGFGFSNNIKPFLSAPPYRKCLFDLKEGLNKISITVRYR